MSYHIWFYSFLTIIGSLATSHMLRRDDPSRVELARVGLSQAEADSNATVQANVGPVDSKGVLLKTRKDQVGWDNQQLGIITIVFLRFGKSTGPEICSWEPVIP